MFKKTATRAEGKINVSTFEITDKKVREEFCEIFMRTGKLFIIEEGVISDKYISIIEPLK